MWSIMTNSMAVSNIGTSMAWPPPPRARCSSAARIDQAMVWPQYLSQITVGA
jgi:hypothetical protein